METIPPKPPVHVYFFRGLSTYGQDNARVSIFDFGPMYKNFARAFPERGIQFHPVLGMGSGTFPEITERALAFFRKDPIWNSEEPVNFIGHSAGGLIARQVLPALLRERGAAGLMGAKVKSLLTIASPNRGSEMARWCLNMPRTHRGSTLFLRAFGYDISKKTKFLDELTPDNVARIFPAQEWIEPGDQPVSVAGVRLASIVCGCPRNEWCLPLRLFYMIKVFRDFTPESDGIVETATQPFAQVLALKRFR